VGESLDGRDSPRTRFLISKETTMKAVARKLAVITTVVVSANMVVLNVFRSASATPRSAVANTGTSLDDIDRTIGDLERQINAVPTSSSLDLLARMQLSRGRITGDADSYAKAQIAVGRSLTIAPRNVEGRSLDTEIRYTNHDFSGARARSAAIVKDAPKEIGALAVRGDAERELGDYPAARATLRELQKVAPASASVIVRQARMEFLSGNPAKATVLAERAEAVAQKSGLLGATLSFYPSFRGQLAFDQGDYRAAVNHFKRALTISEGDRVATLGLGRALAASGKTNDAINLVRALTDRFPDPVAVGVLGDLLAKTGDAKGANDSYALVEAVADLATANKQIYNRELALFYANHDRKLKESLRLAKAEIVDRKDIYGYDALAWSEYKTGHLDEAQMAITDALRLGTLDARLLFHAGMIASARRDIKAAQTHLKSALAISPQFDVFGGDVARAELKKIQSQVASLNTSPNSQKEHCYEKRCS
jgi:tetratricopeptide (TPR) repeat protein